MKDMNFVKTTDPEMAEKLRQMGLQELAKEGSKFVFINDPKNIHFSSNKHEMKNVLFTNMITV